jgi:hypothetical protein
MALPMITRLTLLLLLSSLTACVGANSAVRAERGDETPTESASATEENSGASVGSPGERQDVAVAPEQSISLPDDDDVVNDPTSEPTPLPIDEPGRPVQMR